MAVTVTYCYPVAGTVPPTAAQAAAVNCVTATVAFGADSDTTATVTHDFGLASTDPAALFPAVVMCLAAASAGTAATTVTVTKTNTNAIVLTKGTGAGNNGVWDVCIFRPHSVTR